MTSTTTASTKMLEAFTTNATAVDYEDIDDSDEYEYEYDYDPGSTPIDWAEGGPSLAVYGLTFVVGVVGNVLILVSVARHTHVKHSPVNVFLASLATADLMLVLVCLPLKVSWF